MELVWAPEVIQNVKESELGLYMEFSCTACVPIGSSNVDHALRVLYLSDGDIKLALERLMANYGQDENLNRNRCLWTEEEVQLFEKSIMLLGKNFYDISQAMKTKTVKQCVEFYYLWKKSPIKRTLPPTSNDEISTPSVTTTVSETQEEQFPCKVCGRVFLKIKSRSAHMKRHKNER